MFAWLKKLFGHDAQIEALISVYSGQKETFCHINRDIADWLSSTGPTSISPENRARLDIVQKTNRARIELLCQITRDLNQLRYGYDFPYGPNRS